MIKNIKILLIIVLVFIASYEAFLLDLNLKQRKMLESYLGTLSKSIREINQNFQQKLKDTKKTIESLQMSLETKEKELLKNELEVKDLKGELIDAKNNIDELTKELKIIRNLKEDTEYRFQAILSKLDELKKKNGLVPKQQKLYNELREAQDKLRKQTEKFHVQQQNINNLNSIVYELKNKLNNLYQVLANKELELGSIKKSNDNLKQEVSTLLSEKSYLENQLKNVTTDYENTIRLLAEVAEFNATLEEKLKQFSGPQNERQKAEILKKKIEESMTMRDKKPKREVEVLLIPGEKP